MAARETRSASPRAGSGPSPASSRAGARAPRPGAGPPAQPAILTWLARVADLLILALAVLYLGLLARQAAAGHFATDECFHAYLAEWIAGRASLPRVLPEFYGGLPYFYPPLFHVVGASVFALGGATALPFLNLALTGLLFAFLYWAPIPEVPRPARRWTLLLVLANGSLSQYAIRFYAETLATLLTVVVVVLLLRQRARQRLSDGVWLGVAVGLALLAKQPSVMLPPLLGLVALTDLVRGRRRSAGTLALAIAIGLVIALPWFARNALLFGGPFYPPVTGDAALALDAMNTRMFSLPAAMFYRSAARALGPVVPWLALAALLVQLLRGRPDLRAGVIAACAALVLGGPLIARFEARHLNPFTASLALAALLVLHDALARPRWARVAATFALIAWATVFVARMPDFRAGIDARASGLAAYRAIREHVPEGRSVLSVWTYDTFYYARRPATWPVPWAPSATLLELFLERDPERFEAALERHGVDYVLIPRSRPPARFNGASYPVDFVRCTQTLLRAGHLKLVWEGEAQALIERVR
jgi:hypothetical protein